MNEANEPSHSVAVRLKEARNRRELTQQQAADHLGVARSVIAHIESGRRDARSEELIALAELYGVSVTELIRPKPDILRLKAQFRTLRANDDAFAAEVRPAVERIKRFIDDYSRLERIYRVGDSAGDPPTYSLSGMDEERLGEYAARKERDRLGLNDAPIGDVRELLESEARLHIAVLSMPPGVWAFFVYAQGLGGFVGVNRIQPVERKRWSCCHEYGHFLFTRDHPD